MIRIPLRARDGSIRAWALVDDEDAERLLQFSWSLSVATGRSAVQAYAVRNSSRAAIRKGATRLVKLHRDVLGLGRGDPDVDHRNLDRLDCRRENLRIVPPGANRQNLRGYRRSTSRFRGVSWATREGRWEARMRLGAQQFFIGYFDDEIAAARAVDRFRRERMPWALPDLALAA